MHFFVQLYRQNNQSENSKVFSAFESSITAFDNIFGNIFSHYYGVIEISKFYTQTGSVQKR